MPKALRIVLALGLLGLPVGPAFSQTTDEEQDAAETAEPRGTQGRGPAAEANARRGAACRADATKRNLRGPDLADAVAVCLAEARLACLKRAVDAKVRGPARREYLVKCLAET